MFDLLKLALNMMKLSRNIQMMKFSIFVTIGDLKLSCHDIDLTKLDAKVCDNLAKILLRWFLE